MPLDSPETFDADCMVRMMQSITQRIAEEGHAVVVGRGAPYLLRERSDTFRVFLYAPVTRSCVALLRAGSVRRKPRTWSTPWTASE
jgi:urease accessory protein UreF